LGNNAAPVNPNGKQWYEDRPVNMADYDLHWQKKTKGWYLLGLGRWCRVCRQNTGKDLENKTKLFQILLMITFYCVAIWMIILVTNFGSLQPNGPMIAFMTEYVLGFVCSAVGYFMLQRQWEGYYGHRFLQFLHYLTMVLFSTIIPYGDFLLHMGYRQRGYHPKPLEEPFPDGFEFPREPADYQGYLPRSTRGGFLVFFTLGYLKCFLTLLRMIVVIVYMNEASYYISDSNKLPLIFMFIWAYASFCLIMLLKCLFENTQLRLPDCSCCDKLCKEKKKKGYDGALRSDEEEDMII
jgi:hypothetical protein